ncbi:hypothetical protein [Bradyrhizobium sp. WSM2793]|uniref:hypothetical protein n=1 Tax=Bradyrhizobium sp. WSM2793 TaxID=1038866 RepID=UPI00037F26BD|nr:hypothetical protein [Bradyrhizobium sp. WSM2793]
MMSAIGSALGSTFGLGNNLAAQAKDETEELRRKRIEAAKTAGFSPAGQALAIDFGTMSVPGATA